MTTNEMAEERFDFLTERMNIGMISDEVWEWQELAQYPFEMWPELLRLRAELAARTAEVERLMTLIDFCNEAESLGRSLSGVVREVHDMAHVLLGGDTTLDKWYPMTEDHLRLADDSRWATPAWPDVRRRMKSAYDALNPEPTS